MDALGVNSRSDVYLASVEFVILNWRMSFYWSGYVALGGHYFPLRQISGFDTWRALGVRVEATHDCVLPWDADILFLA